MEQDSFFYKLTHRNLFRVIENRLINMYFIMQYHFIKRDFTEYHVDDIDRTLTLIEEQGQSISRFGDGEFKWIQMKSQDSFQTPDAGLSKRLEEVLKSSSNHCMIGLPDAFSGMSQFTRNGKDGWRMIMARDVHPILPLLDKNRHYGNANISRPYMDFNNKNAAETIFKHFKRIWRNRNLLIVEGAKSRLGIGNDLFSGSESVQRILCPEINAWSVYEEIKSTTVSYAQTLDNPLIIIALGPTATVLAYDLSETGIQALDLGHIDIEYEWMKKHYLKKHAIPGKYVNEAPTEGGRLVSADIQSDTYHSEILVRIGSDEK
ncbi:GT-D fold domain-containing glycosyltransferase [Lactiplantibacillus pentosus]|uniref:GT-D fold domain-containing glycosyltransferase n=1 Tax=Lactiplantibacillus pentosus TaxID=1589 RepID=UPI0021821F8E|nr:GT-D fold domain-containing glycosyltransferase [Lactiplantibacillus pentosus]MCT0162160.1 DUF1792 domain-containing protein [Lactiplantibacillus pentosus]